MLLSSIDTLCEQVTDKLSDRDAPNVPFSSGLKSLDRALGGFWAGDLVLVKVQSVVASTQLAVTLALNVSSLLCGTVVLLSLRQNRIEFAQRILSRVQSKKIDLPRADGCEGWRVLKGRKVFVSDEASLNCGEIGTEISALGLSESSRVQMVLIDGIEHLSLVGSRGVAAELALVGKEMQAPVVALTHVTEDSLDSYRALERAGNIVISVRQDLVLGEYEEGRRLIEVLKHPRKPRCFVVSDVGELSD